MLKDQIELLVKALNAPSRRAFADEEHFYDYIESCTSITRIKGGVQAKHKSGFDGWFGYKPIGTDLEYVLDEFESAIEVKWLRANYGLCEIRNALLQAVEYALAKGYCRIALLVLDDLKFTRERNKGIGAPEKKLIRHLRKLLPRNGGLSFFWIIRRSDGYVCESCCAGHWHEEDRHLCI